MADAPCIHHAHSGTIDTTANQPRMADPAYVGDLFAALAALTQRATYPADVEMAIGLIRHAIGRGRAAIPKAQDDLLAVLERLAWAAACRENTMGDPCRLLEVQAELREAAASARETIARVKEGGRGDPLRDAAPDLLAALRSVEWCGQSTLGLCPSCSATEGQGHAEGCDLAVAIAKAEGRSA